MASNITQDDENTMKILIATDIHLGYIETHPVRGDDSFITFEEILKLGVKHKVDFVLLGGDLFHDGKPSVNCLSRCMDLLNRYCMGHGEVNINVLSDPAEIFSFSANPMVNYMNPNLNVALPIFSIHGNHDDPLGYNAKCSLDMLSAAGLINYFGKYTNLQDDISLVPLLISKGNTRVAIYGLGSLKDKMASRLFRQEQVNIMQPEEPDSWFNIMVLHQNRSAHTKDECLHESYLPESMNLVFWGHEHECRIEPEFNATRNFYVTQPGSSVATSLCEGESREKKVGILYVKGTKFHMRPIPLETVRPFIFDVVDLATEYRDKPSRTMKQGVQAFLEQRVEELLREAEGQLTGNPKQPKLPLVRLRVECFKQEELFNTVRFGLQFEEKVANPTDMIAIKRPQAPKKIKVELDQDVFDSAKTESVLHNVEELVEKYFNDCEAGKRMQVLPVVSVNEALAQQMKGDLSAFDIVIKKIKDKVVKSILDKGIIEEDEIREELEAIRDTKNGPENAEQIINEVRGMLEEPRENGGNADEDTLMSINDEDPFAESTSRGRGAKTTRARGRGRGVARGRKVAQISDEDDENPYMDEPPARPARGPGSRGGRGSRARGAKAAAPSARKTSPPPSMNITRYTRPTQPKPGNRIGSFFDDDSD
ncbi:double-strand break repair protein MRE11 [Cloeon dipterum]|uniref:double-strand break repair protein MRE11 n=1 Tax=Cloeon dipterum TaxID=197152 RepID=UPI0032201EB8